MDDAADAGSVGEQLAERLGSALGGHAPGLPEPVVELAVPDPGLPCLVRQELEQGGPDPGSASG